jgi:sec-independent protein translocase protein TatA
MGPLGMPEMIFIFVVALLIFGPKKLPELGKTLGKAMTEFRRASNDLKSTFDREMTNLERETASTTKEIKSGLNYDTYNYESSSYDPDSGYAEETNPYSASASAPEGAQLTAATPEVDGSVFVSALEGSSNTTASEPVPPQGDSDRNGHGVEPQAVQG